VDVSAGVRGERVAADEYEKGDVRDFALWKAAKPEDEAVGAVWETPWGPGRPGWHIECSVMSMAELGETFDIHLGGVDLIFPHHEDEIAQSEGATGKTFARYWLHGEFLLLEGDKMAKSTGNIFTVPDLLERGVTASAIRYTFLTAHYRSKLNFTFEALGAGAEAVRRMVGTHDRLRAHPRVRHPEGDDRPTLEEASSPALGAFTAAMDDDLNTSVALSAVMELVRPRQCDGSTSSASAPSPRPRPTPASTHFGRWTPFSASSRSPPGSSAVDVDAIVELDRMGRGAAPRRRAAARDRRPRLREAAADRT
jgi:cysteinyl-tRNA synthetase